MKLTKKQFEAWGRKGGLKKTAKKSASSRVNAARAREARLLKHKKGN